MYTWGLDHGGGHVSNKVFNDSKLLLKPKQMQ